MDTTTRRDLLKYAVGATLVSALPVSAQNHRDTTHLPLVLDLSGPMAFEYSTSGKTIDVWLPHLEQIDEHEAGIVTPSRSYVLDENDYTITGPSGSNNKPTPYICNCTIYPASTTLNVNRFKNRFIRLTIPMPTYLVALLPVQAKVYSGPTCPSGWDSLATGLRFVYDTAGTVILTLTQNNKKVTQFDFEPTPGEKQLNMSIGYTPFDSRDDGHPKAKKVFVALAALFLNLSLNVCFEGPAMAGLSEDQKRRGTPFRPCRAPIILQS
jgi:hypothetical protein